MSVMCGVCMIVIWLAYGWCMSGPHVVGAILCQLRFTWVSLAAHRWSMRGSLAVHFRYAYGSLFVARVSPLAHLRPPLVHLRFTSGSSLVFTCGSLVSRLVHVWFLSGSSLVSGMVWLYGVARCHRRQFLGCRWGVLVPGGSGLIPVWLQSGSGPVLVVRGGS